MPVKGIIGKIAGAVSGLWANKATQSTDTQKSIAAPMTDCFEVSSLFLAMHSASKAPGMMQRTIGTATIVNYNFWVRIHVRVGVRIGLNLYTTSRPYRNIRIAELLECFCFCLFFLFLCMFSVSCVMFSGSVFRVLFSVSVSVSFLFL